MLDLEHVNADKIKIDLENANNVAMFIELSIILENNFCFTDEEIREAKEDLESLLKTLEWKINTCIKKNLKLFFTSFDTPNRYLLKG